MRTKKIKKPKILLLISQNSEHRRGALAALALQRSSLDASSLKLDFFGILDLLLLLALHTISLRFCHIFTPLFDFLSIRNSKVEFQCAQK